MEEEGLWHTKGLAQKRKIKEKEEKNKTTKKLSSRSVNKVSPIADSVYSTSSGVQESSSQYVLLSVEVLAEDITEDTVNSCTYKSGRAQSVAGSEGTQKPLLNSAFTMNKYL